MKRVFVMLAAVLMVAAGAMADKETVAVKLFDYANSVGENEAFAVRSKVMEAITNSNRVNVVDFSNDAALLANYVIDGHVVSVSSTSKVLDTGNTVYDARVTYTLKVTDKDGNLLDSDTFEAASNSLIGLYYSQKDAVNGAADYIPQQLKAWVDKNFKISGTILEIAEVKKNEAKAVYISLGSADGTAKNLKFEVKMEKMVGNSPIYKSIGEIKVESVDAPNVSLCKVTKGGVEIYDAFNSGATLILESKDSRTGMDKFKSGLKSTSTFLGL